VFLQIYAKGKICLLSYRIDNTTNVLNNFVKSYEKNTKKHEKTRAISEKRPFLTTPPFPKCRVNWDAMDTCPIKPSVNFGVLRGLLGSFRPDRPGRQKTSKFVNFIKF